MLRVTKVMFSDKDKFRLRDQFRDRCGYCQTFLSSNNLEWDHIIPQKRHGGSDDEHNRAPSCGQCNRNKSDAVDEVDPVTGSKASESRGRLHAQYLFDPRRDSWNDHFVWMRLAERAPYPVGKTIVGRATAS